MPKINENTELSIPLKNIITMIIVTAVAVWAYFGITKRLDFLEYQRELLTNISLDSRDRVRELELKTKELEYGVCK